MITTVRHYSIELFKIDSQNEEMLEACEDKIGQALFDLIDENPGCTLEKVVPLNNDIVMFVFSELVEYID